MAAVRMRDVARQAGVSVMTVSNVINDRSNVGAGTRLRVLEVIDQLGYEVNLSARRLRAGRSDTIALVVPRFDHPYFGELAAGFADVLAQHGQHLVVEQSGASPQGERDAISHARLQMYDGVVLSVVGLATRDVERLRPQVPMVLVGEHDAPPGFDHIAMANVAGGRLATEHLLGTGSRRVAILGGAQPATTAGASELRSDGWREAHRQAGLDVDPALVVVLDDLETRTARETLGRRIADGLRPDAVFAVTDQVALGALAALHDLGLRVPEDVRVVGFDNLAIGAAAVPGLTSIDPSSGWIVEQASALLLRRIGGEQLPPQHLIAPVTLVQRGSTRRG